MGTWRLSVVVINTIDIKWSSAAAKKTSQWFPSSLRLQCSWNQEMNDRDAKHVTWVIHVIHVIHFWVRRPSTSLQRGSGCTRWLFATQVFWEHRVFPLGWAVQRFMLILESIGLQLPLSWIYWGSIWPFTFAPFFYYHPFWSNYFNIQSSIVVNGTFRAK